MVRTADQLLTGLKRRNIIPASQKLLQDTDLLALADDITTTYMVPMILSLREEYFVIETTIPIINGQEQYDIPYRSIGRSLRDLKISDVATTRSLTRIYLEDAHLFKYSSAVRGFYIRGDKINLVPIPDQSGLNLEVWWLMQPNRLCTASNAAQVVSITDDTVTCASVPSNIISGSVIDFIQGVQGNQTYDFDITVSSIAGNQIIFSSGDVPTALAAGDYISLAQTSPVIQLPDECYSALETIVAQRILQTIGDIEGANSLQDVISTELKNLKMMLEPRVIGEPTKIINRNNLLRGRKTRYKYGWLIR